MPGTPQSPDEAAWMAVALEQAEAARAAGEVPVGAVVVLDGAQAVSHVDIDVEALDCDFYDEQNFCHTS